MPTTILEVFQAECGSLAIDANLVKKLRMFESGFVGRSAEHIEFFGGHLMGVHQVKFLPSDQMRWFDEIIKADEMKLRTQLHALDSINPDWKVSSNTFNLSVAWLIHSIYASKLLDDKQKHQGMTDALLILEYKYFTSLLFHYYRYPANRDVAEATFNALTDKFTIKKLGNWSAVFRDRAATLLALDSPHMKNNLIQKFDNDENVIYFLSDTQGRIRDMMKNIYGVFDQIHKSGTTISSVSAVTDHDGEEILKDKTKSLAIYTRYLASIITDKPSFIREELVNVILQIMHTAPPSLFHQTLNWISDHYRHTNYGLVEQVMNECLVHSFAYFDESRLFIRAHPDLGTLLARLKGVYSSSRSTDPTLLKLRDDAESLVKMATKNSNDSTLASVRTALLLYLVARSITMTHYSG